MNVTPAVQKLIVSVVILGMLGFVAWNTIFGEAEVQLVDGALPETSVVGQDILDLSEKLKNININKAVFSSSLFTNLIDLSVKVNEEPQGRVNPFSPIGSENSSVSTTKTTSRP